MKDKNIDQLFRDAAQAEKAPHYDNAYWTEMNAILDAKDAKRKGFIYWTLGETGVLAVLMLLLFSYNNTSEKYTQDTLIITAPSSNEKELTSKFFTRQVSHQQIVQSQNSNPTPGLSQNKKAIQSEPIIETLDKKSLDHQSEINEDILLTESANPTSPYSAGNEVLNNHLEESESAFEKEIQLSNKEIFTLPIINLYQLEENSIKRLRYSQFEYKPRPSYGFYAKLSGGIMENYKTSRPFESGLFDLSLNFEVNFNNLLLRTGFGTQYTTNADLIVSQRKKVYDYKIIEVQSDLSYQGLLDIYIPIELGYRFKSTSFGVGVQANYLTTTNMNLSVYEDNDLVSTERFKGKKNGLNSFSTQGYVWLEQNITPRIAVGLKIGTNISGRLIKNSGYFNNSSTTNPIYGQLSLRYNLLR